MNIISKYGSSELLHWEWFLLFWVSGPHRSAASSSRGNTAPSNPPSLQQHTHANSNLLDSQPCFCIRASAFEWGRSCLKNLGTEAHACLQQQRKERETKCKSQILHINYKKLNSTANYDLLPNNAPWIWVPNDFIVESVTVPPVQVCFFKSQSYLV